MKNGGRRWSPPHWDLEDRLDSLFTAFWRKLESRQQQALLPTKTEHTPNKLPPRSSDKPTSTRTLRDRTWQTTRPGSQHTRAAPQNTTKRPSTRQTANTAATILQQINRAAPMYRPHKESRSRKPRKRRCRTCTAELPKRLLNANPIQGKQQGSIDRLSGQESAEPPQGMDELETEHRYHITPAIHPQCPHPEPYFNPVR
ncbi:Hypothetical predicted protein [Pelobates cultripes]|uniref:Uncharacterized protein n=1 Tax=Pelobates cultripes TaxID=61616 RepID=A0AAD1WP88_PELCU|nr:Hypothetical predicted protein [Pelobates cultripes]